ncbi:MAG: T9SS type A sorting domain-containing protein [Ignavibacteria bacterium]|nr:T9SS type A sorting domain-containing protein [Ignavibacteria bacterium]
MGSTSWVSIRGNLPTNLVVYDLRLKNNILYIATNGGVWNSTNEGTNWSNINIFNFSTHFTTIEVLNTHIIASTQNKVYITADNGSNWADITGALPVTINNQIREIAYNSNYIFVILENTGFVYHRPLSEIIISITPISTNVPDRYSLSQNYPNPFNPTTNINFTVPKSGFVKMNVYDINGREVSTLVNQEMTPGTYKVDFDASNLSSGIYYYSMTSGDIVETKRMTLVK